MDSSGRYLAGTTWSKSLTWLPMRQTQEKRLRELAPQGHPSPGAMGLQGLRTAILLARQAPQSPGVIRRRQRLGTPPGSFPSAPLVFPPQDVCTPSAWVPLSTGGRRERQGRNEDMVPVQTLDLLLSPKSLSVRLRSRPGISGGPVLLRSPRGPQPGGSEAQGSMQHGNSESSEHLQREKFASLGGGARKSHV